MILTGHFVQSLLNYHPMLISFSLRVGIDPSIDKDNKAKLGQLFKYLLEYLEGILTSHFNENMEIREKKKKKVVVDDAFDVVEALEVSFTSREHHLIFLSIHNELH